MDGVFRGLLLILVSNLLNTCFMFYNLSLENLNNTYIYTRKTLYGEVFFAER
jgi:hypothetical protein